ncbi:MAG: hypothetical protein HYX53_16495 [Chloroflexi bacterium]|nr:hypothetical protein [Chloroflexota bacterium]
MTTESRASHFRDMTGATPEEYAADRAYLARPLSDDEAERFRRALQRMENLNQRILRRTGGRGIPDEEIQAALDEADDH